MNAQIRWNSAKSKYELVYKNQVLVSSKSHDYLNYLVVKQKHAAVRKAKVTTVEIVSYAPSEIVISGPEAQVTVQATSQTPAISFNINERFDFMEQLVGMVMNKTAKSMIISGEGGVGKTFTVLDVLKKAGKVDVATLVPSVEDFKIEIEDDETSIEEKVMAQMNQPKGDYSVIKGHASAAALYRVLYENRERTVIFDDCDSVLKDGSALNLLKAALDSYDERWINWRTERAFGESDLPNCFKFKGSIIFISNMPLYKIDEAVRTRCFKVDLSMSKQQRIERMRSVLSTVMPDVELDMKKEALALLEKNLDVTDDINFRTLMNLISIRVDPNVKDWKKLGMFTLTEQ